MSQLPPLPPDPASGPGDNPAPATSRLALTSMILAIIGLITVCLGIGVILAIIAVILGIMAVVQINKQTGNVKGAPFAVVGISLGGLALLLIIPMLVIMGILLPGLGAARKTANMMKNNSQVRSIVQANLIYAQDNGSFYAGLTSDGNILPPKDLQSPLMKNVPLPAHINGGHPAARLALLIDGNYLAADKLISPGESSSISKWPLNSSAPFTPQYYSYALLQLVDDSQTSGSDFSTTPRHLGRLSEWRDTTNSMAVVVSDRNLAANPGRYRSIWTSSEKSTTNGWRGAVGFNDQHVESHTDCRDTIVTKYGKIQNSADNLFTTDDGNRSATDANAMMVTGP